MATDNSCRVAVIGAGPGGLAAGHELLAQGFSNFTIFEKASAVGGTWHLHTYPGLACDVWAHYYTFSYRPNPDWSANFAEQAEIQAYLQQCATEFGLDPHIELNTKIVTAKYQDNQRWLLTTESGEQHEFDAVINAMGNQHTPVYPDVEGIDSFQGDYWHGTRWNHDVSLDGKRAVVVGSAASAIQIVPEIAPQLKHLTVLQRSPNWIMARNRKPYSAWLKNCFKHFPWLVRMHRWAQAKMMGFVLDGVRLGHKRMEQFEAQAKKFIEQSISDPELRAAVTPDTRYGCKRGLVSDDFYTTLTRDNVELVAEGLQAVTPSGIRTASGREIETDIIIYCTGYRILDYDRIKVTGRDGQNLAEVMNAAPQSYKGIVAPGFPNYFFAAGPNGLCINVSFFTVIEQNVKSIVKLLVEKEQAGIKAIDVKRRLHEEYNAELKRHFAEYSWGHPSCTSYYRTADGYAPFLYPGGFKDYARMQSEISLQDFDAVTRGAVN